MSACILSWAPFWPGLPGCVLSGTIPRLIHQALRVVGPRNPVVVANGVPLSLLTTFGSPNLEKSPSNLSLTAPADADSISLTSSTALLARSLTVSGRHLSPSDTHHPLKSTVHTSFGFSAGIIRLMDAADPAGAARTRRGATRPALPRTR